MTKEEIEEYINNIELTLPRRMTGNEINHIICERLEPYIEKDRDAILELLKEWIGIRVKANEEETKDSYGEGAMWLALEIASRFHLTELKNNVRDLIEDINAGRTYLPVYVNMIERHLNKI